METAADVEVVKDTQRAVVDRKLAYPAELDLLDDETFFASDDEDEEEEEEEAGDETAEPAPVVKVVTDARKTRAQRNREKRREKAEREELRIREAKKISKGLQMYVFIAAPFAPELLGEIKKSVKKQEREQLMRTEARERAKQEKQLNETTRVGPHAFKPQYMEVQLTEEIADSLRELRPEGNVFKDRFQSLQKRSLIEPRFHTLRYLIPRFGGTAEEDRTTVEALSQLDTSVSVGKPATVPAGFDRPLAPHPPDSSSPPAANANTSLDGPASRIIITASSSSTLLPAIPVFPAASAGPTTSLPAFPAAATTSAGPTSVASSPPQTTANKGVADLLALIGLLPEDRRMEALALFSGMEVAKAEAAKEQSRYQMAMLQTPAA
ncbi:hypothetical protein BDK51DRAFT_30163 [Blyttiomyces helicus]|uniref:Ribosome biogenesis protein NOP53 n=1 Tax=Blyttiomyces helicus TaxID=388810 RepID=A0A4P9WKH9_9FUNG|nr:hypothetical protein BDK51DRAFT_30163 [Blyttiomyces helicus]|eukprot:RKO92902.1 hypothetical protein BDK51DRAFT_30163 [Blyttiomyces helicus]